MRVLIGCEFSGVVRRAFRERGHDAWSCDILSAEDVSPHHIREDVIKHLRWDWDLILLFPPCTALCVSGNGTYAGSKEREEAKKWTVELWELAKEACPRVALENPVGVLSSVLGTPQYIQMWEYGHRETKKTGLWLHNLPRLIPTDNVGPPPKDPEKRKSWERVWRMAPSPNRGLERSRFLPGVAAAMADQWGVLD